MTDAAPIEDPDDKPVLAQKETGEVVASKEILNKAFISHVVGALTDKALSVRAAKLGG